MSKNINIEINKATPAQVGVIVSEFVRQIKKYSSDGIILTDSKLVLRDSFVRATDELLRRLDESTPTVDTLKTAEAYLSWLVDPVLDGEFFAASVSHETIQNFLDRLEIAGSSCEAAIAASKLH